jgi:hypothetical protein
VLALKQNNEEKDKEKEDSLPAEEEADKGKIMTTRVIDTARDKIRQEVLLA